MKKGRQGQGQGNKLKHIFKCVASGDSSACAVSPVLAFVLVGFFVVNPSSS